MDVGTPKTSREWWYLLIILLLAEFIFMHIIYTTVLDKSAQHAWEFGHVLIAIVLAVIAIVYGMFQGITQESNTQKIAGQIDSLQEVVKTVTGTTSELSGGVDQLKNLARKLEDIGQVVMKSNTAIEDMSDWLKIIGQVEPKQKTGSPTHVATAALSNDALTTFLKALPVGATNVLYGLHLIDGKKFSLHRLSQIINEVQVEGKKKEALPEPTWMQGFVAGLTTMAVMTLKAFGLLEATSSGADATYTVAEPFKTVTKEYFSKSGKDLGYGDRAGELEKIKAKVEEALTAT